MEEPYYTKVERQAAEQLAELLARPIAPSAEMVGAFDEKTNKPKYFDPWDILPIYGSYSSDFDNIALEVLNSMLSGEYKEETLAHEMFREMLCYKNLCDYGTSPRVCFPTTQFEKLLQDYIDKWKQHYKLVWEV